MGIRITLRNNNSCHASIWEDIRTVQQSLVHQRSFECPGEEDTSHNLAHGKRSSGVEGPWGKTESVCSVGCCAEAPVQIPYLPLQNNQSCEAESVKKSQTFFPPSFDRVSGFKREVVCETLFNFQDPACR